jgi:hypothetical protein
LLLKDYRKRPGIAEILEMEQMKTRMQMYGYKKDDHLLSSSMAGDFKLAKSQEPKPLVDLEKLKKELGVKNQRLLGAKPIAEIKQETPIELQ